MGERRIERGLAMSAAIMAASHGIAYAAKPEAAHFAYVADAVNQINYLKASSSNAKDHSEEIADTACKMLTQLRSDEQFTAVVKKGWLGGMSAEQKKTLSQVAVINDAIDKEKQALDNVGIDSASSIQAQAAAIPLAKSIDTEKLDPGTILSDVGSCRKGHAH